MTARDQVPYSTDAVIAYLPAVWDENYLPPVLNAPDSGIRTKVDPRRVPDWLLSRADVQTGFRRARLSHTEKECLRHVYHLGYTPGELSAVWSVPSEQIHSTCAEGIKRIATYLSGERTPA